MRDYTKVLNEYISKGFSFFFIDGRVFARRLTYFEVVDIDFTDRVLRGGDYLGPKDIEYCEEVVYLPTIELVWYYLLTRHKA